MPRQIRFGRWIAAILGVAVLGLLVWASDKISYEGERTVYTVRCVDGVWKGSLCTGRLAADERYRFRASKSRQEVLYWIVGSASPSGKFTDCTVKDRGNWKCNASPGQPPTITREMVNGRPTIASEGSDGPLHTVRKLEWWILRTGLVSFTTAD